MPANPVARIVVERREQAKWNLIAALDRPPGHRPVNRIEYAWPTGTPRLEVSNMDARKRPARRQAVQEGKQAVRAYAREPSRANADAVELAWRKVRQQDSLANGAGNGRPDRCQNGHSNIWADRLVRQEQAPGIRVAALGMLTGQRRCGVAGQGAGGRRRPQFLMLPA